MIPGSVVMGLGLLVDPWAKNVEFRQKGSRLLASWR